MTDLIIERGALDTLQAGVVAALKAEPFLADVPVLHERVEDLAYQIDLALAGLQEQGGGMGICCVVLTPRFRVSNPNVPGPYCDPVNLVVRIMENVLINMSDTGTKKPASLVCEVVANRIHHLTLPGFAGCINVQDGGIVSVPGYLAYQVNATTECKLTRKEP